MVRAPETLEELAKLTSPSWRIVLTSATITADDIAAAQQDPSGPPGRSLAELWFRFNYDTETAADYLVRIQQAGFWYRMDELRAAKFVYWPWFVLPLHWRIKNWLSNRAKVPRTVLIVVWLALIALVLFGS
jgi:hypothetical protein